jgi:hypothetical protein
VNEASNVKMTQLNQVGQVSNVKLAKNRPGFSVNQALNFLFIKALTCLVNVI